MNSKPYSRSDADLMMQRDEQYILRPWSGTGEPVPIVSAQGSIVTDAYGKEFIDFTSGYFVNQAGHCHPKVTAAASRQAATVTQVSGRHSTPPIIDIAEKLIKRAPSSVHKVFFTTGGSEANEHALKIVRQHKKKGDVAVIDNAYHGLTLGVLGGCSNPKYRETAGVPLPDHYYRLPTPYCYRCKHEQDCATQCLDGVERQFDERPTTGALLAEPVQAVGGIIPPEKWWHRLDQMRKKRGILLILDEIQTGLGRTGAMFAAEHYGLEPELITAGKGLSGGIGSLGAVLVDRGVGAGYFAGTTPTSAGNAVSAAAGCALIDVIEEEGLLKNAAAMGRYLTDSVADLDDAWVGDIRFKGLLGGVELVRDRTSKEVLHKDLVVAVKDALHEDGMLLTISGPHGNVLRLQPPLSISTPQIDALVQSMARALNQVRGGGAGGGPKR
jgi:4-aminobutyrate aminotransferase-like enzyme